MGPHASLRLPRRVAKGMGMIRSASRESRGGCGRAGKRSNGPCGSLAKPVETSMPRLRLAGSPRGRSLCLAGDLPRVVGAPRHRARDDVAKTHALRLATQVVELPRRDEAEDLELVGARLEILAERQDVDVVL